jgi:hypothetical protein
LCQERHSKNHGVTVILPSWLGSDQGAQTPSGVSISEAFK